ncbi:MAG: 3-deoxy-manno-octulosonate cytidylyltransferase [Lautropia sp.]|nr:3-deoxy-manno-octulosonate cytidylyltransferase [Lautropia sp.]
MNAPAAPFVVLIPARLASTRLPNKPLADIGGLPMVIRVARQAGKSGADRVVIATDSAEIAQAAREHGQEVIMTRADHQSGTERLAEAITLMELADETIVVNVQGDEPEMPPELIDALATCLAQDAECPMATAVHPVQSPADWLNPNVVKVVADAHDRALMFSRAPLPWHRKHLVPGIDPDSDACRAAFAEARPLRHIGMYAYRSSFLTRYARMAPCPLEDIEALEQLRVLYHGHRIKLLHATEAPPAGVDTPDDLVRVRARFAR